MKAADRYAGRLYRALNPICASEPLSGPRRGTLRRPLQPEGNACALRVAHADDRARVRPIRSARCSRVLVAYDADIRPVFDTRDADALLSFGMTHGDLASTGWRDGMIANGESSTQKFARRLIAEGYAALIVRSFARGASRNAVNLVLWRWSPGPPTKLVVIDDDGRLSRDPGE